MAKKKTDWANPGLPDSNTGKEREPDEKKNSKPAREKETARDTIESIVFAFVLAFLFRTFEAEAFVIPTGSMAPTLFGRHKDLECTQCGYEFEVGASTEILREGNIVVQRIQRALCPNCRSSNRNAFEAPPFKGDRILVNKFQYELQPPRRFDVVVFKYPEDAKTNYIKRLIGLPGETISIHGGNVYKTLADGREQILRKDDPDKQRRIQIPVYDDQYPARELIAAGWPERWAGVERVEAGQEDLNDEVDPLVVAGWAETTRAWKLDPDSRSYQLPLEVAQQGEPQWLRYRHFAPQQQNWERFKNDDPLGPKPRLIGDFCGYNSTSTQPFRPNSDEVFWVGDLTLSGTVTIGEFGPTADLVFELTEGVHWYRCHLNPATGAARLTQIDIGLNPDEEIELATAQTDFQGAGTYDFVFANVDDRLCLWIDDELIDFGPAAAYEISQLQGALPQQSDLSPVGIAATAIQATVSDLLLERDIYYRGAYSSNENDTLLLDNVSAWQKAYLNNRREWDLLEYEIPEDHFFVLGDNSPRSLDGRFWETTNTVPREAFVGKAFFVYWPHGIPIGVESGNAIRLSYHKTFDRNGGLVTDRSYPLHYIPFYPDFWRMQRIR